MMMKVCLAFAVCLATLLLPSVNASSSNSQPARQERRKEREGLRVEFPLEWHLWKGEHKKQYEDVREELSKHLVWLGNQEYINQHNKYAHVFGYTLKMNSLGDMSSQDYGDMYMCVQGSHVTNASLLNGKHGTSRFRDYARTVSSYPESVDWRTAGAVTSVKDQLRCGCSYAFSAIGALEGATALAHGNLIKLSEQNIVDCSVPYGNHGCACGDINNAFLYVIDNDGVDTWSSYPFRSKQNVCSYSKNGRGGTASGVVTINSGDEASLMSALATVGPISTYVDASHSSFQFYSGGVLDIPHCSRTRLSHAVLLIGYGTYRGKDYWLVKNSWGPNWGINGYIMMARNKSNQCGIATAASFPTL